MIKDETYFRRALTDLMDDVLKPFMQEQIKSEVYIQVRQQLFTELRKEAYAVIQEIIEREVKKKLRVEIIVDGVGGLDK